MKERSRQRFPLKAELSDEKIEAFVEELAAEYGNDIEFLKRNNAELKNGM